MRVLVISHNSVGESNRKRIDAVAAVPGVQVALLTPRWWFEEGRRIEVSTPHAEGYTWRVGRTLLTNNGTRHMYLSGLLSLLRRFKPDVIDLHEEPFSLVALQTLVARDALAPRSAFVFCSYVNIQRRWNHPYQAVEDIILRRADGATRPTPTCRPSWPPRGCAPRLRSSPAVWTSRASPKRSPWISPPRSAAHRAPTWASSVDWNRSRGSTTCWRPRLGCAAPERW
jgi:hypothetical protein